jgi:hypothetical protein
VRGKPRYSNMKAMRKFEFALTLCLALLRKAGIEPE